MGEIIFLDKPRADFLKSLGFQYMEKIIDGKCAFVFVQTNELMEKISENFDAGSFLVGTTVNF